MGKLTRRKRRNNKNNNNHANNNNHSIEQQLQQQDKYNNNNNDPTKKLISRGTIFQFIISWFVIGIVVNYMSSSPTSNNTNDKNNNITNSSNISIDVSPSLSTDTLNNTLNNAIIESKDELESYHEIIKIPKVWKYIQQQQQDTSYDKRMKLKQFKVYNVIDFTTNVNGTIMKQFGTDNDSTSTLTPYQKLFLSIVNIPNTIQNKIKSKNNKKEVIRISRYNEIRKGMYTTSLFQNDTYTIDSYKGERIVHIGIDVYASPNTKVYSFSDGIMHSFGYNSAKGDYGYVIF